jgi:hypothetical protein
MPLTSLVFGPARSSKPKFTARASSLHPKGRKRPGGASTQRPPNDAQSRSPGVRFTLSGVTDQSQLTEKRASASLIVVS